MFFIRSSISLYDPARARPVRLRVLLMLQEVQGKLLMPILLIPSFFPRGCLYGFLVILVFAQS